MRESKDIDVVAIDALEETMLCGECKWRSDVDVSEVVRTWRHRLGLLGAYDPVPHYLITKRVLGDGVAAHIALEAHVVSIEDML